MTTADGAGSGYPAPPLAVPPVPLLRLVGLARTDDQRAHLDRQAEEIDGAEGILLSRWPSPESR